MWHARHGALGAGRLAAGPIVVLALLLVHQACDREFPAQPTPIANSPVTTLSGTTYSGTVVVGGTTTPFNMTLIARALGQAATPTTLAQAVGTVEVTGSFETGAGLRGTVAGTLQEGTLAQGVFEGRLDPTVSPDAAPCTASYSGRVTSAVVQWAFTGMATPGCPLTSSINLTRTGSAPCSYSLTASPPSFPASGGNGTLTVSTPSGCVWQPVSSDTTWLDLTNREEQVGTGTAPFIVTQNAGAARQAQLRISGQTASTAIAQSALSFGFVTLTVNGIGIVRIPADLRLPPIALCQNTTGDGPVSCPGIQVPTGLATVLAIPGNVDWAVGPWTGCVASAAPESCTLTVQAGQAHVVTHSFRIP